MPKIAVILSGCGFQDGAEVREAVFTLLALDKAGAEFECFAPDIEQQDVINHLTGQPSNEKRNVLVESARIARGDIKPLEQLHPADFDALVIPGGFGVAKNLSDFASKGPEAIVLPSFHDRVETFHEQGKPIGAICIAPAVIMSTLGQYHPKVTIGNDEGTASAIVALGGEPESHDTSDKWVWDAQNKIASTPAYMLDQPPAIIYEGVEQVVKKVVQEAKALSQAA